MKMLNVSLGLLSGWSRGPGVLGSSRVELAALRVRSLSLLPRSPSLSLSRIGDLLNTSISGWEARVH